MKHLKSKYHLSAECFLSFDFSQAFVNLQKGKVLIFIHLCVLGKLNASVKFAFTRQSRLSFKVWNVILNNIRTVHNWYILF